MNLDPGIIAAHIAIYFYCMLTGYFRLLPSGPVLALLPVGPCRLFGPTTCFVAYNIGNGLCLNVALSVINTMYFRYRLIHTTQLSQARIRKNVMAAVVLPLILAVSSSVVLISMYFINANKMPTSKRNILSELV